MAITANKIVLNCFANRINNSEFYGKFFGTFKTHSSRFPFIDKSFRKQKVIVFFSSFKLSFSDVKIYFHFISFYVVCFQKKILFCIIISQHSWRKQDNYFRNINFMHSNSIGSVLTAHLLFSFRQISKNDTDNLNVLVFFLNEIPKTTTKCYLQFKW